MKAQMFVRGMRDPIEIEKEEADGIQIILASAATPDAQPIVIEGVWTGKKGDVRYVVFPSNTEEKYNRHMVDPMTKDEAVAFEAELDECVAEAEEKMGPGKKFYKREFWLQKMGAIRLDIYTTAFGIKGSSIVVRNVELYNELSYKLQRYDERKHRDAYAQQMADKQLAQTAESMGIEVDVGNLLRHMTGKVNEGERCECHCFLNRNYRCRHDCEKCWDSNPTE